MRMLRALVRGRGGVMGLGMAAIGLSTTGVIASAPPNDACSGAITLTRGVAVAASNTETVSDGLESTCGFNDTKDVWFTFRSTEFANYRVQTDASSALDTTVAVYTGCGGMLLGCNDDSPDAGLGHHWSRVDFNMSPNQSVRIRVAGWGGAQGAFVLKLDTVPVFHPANDECAAATPLTLGEPLHTTTIGCTGTDITSCGEDDFYDAWYSFVAPRDGTYDFTPTNTDIFGLFFAAFPSCGGTEMACGLRALSIPMTAGQRILVRAAYNGGTAAPFTMNIGPAQPPATPTNDECAGAIPILGTGTTAGTTRGATGYDTGNIFGCTLIDTGPGVWYQFVAPSAGLYSFDTNGSPTLEDTAIVLFDTCTSAGGTGLHGCDDNLGEGLHSRVLWQADDAGQSVYIVVAGQHHSAGDFLLSASQDIVSPPNDLCANAIPIPPSGSITGDNFLAENIDISPSVCDEGFFPMYYSFIAPADATYLFDVLQSPDLPYGAVAVYDTCGGNQLACGPDRFARLAMRAGESVIVRVSSSLFYRGAFTLRASTTEPGPGNDRCDAATPIAFGTSSHATNRGATGSSAMGDCGSPEATGPADVWYEFVPPASGSYTFTASGFILPGLTVFGGCWPQTPDAIACVDGCQAPAALDVALDAGQAVKVRVRPCFMGFGGLKDFGAFTFAVGSTSLGACCSGATCRVDVATGCAGSVDQFNGAGTACTAAGACCRADFNHRDGLSVQDIFDYLNAWFAGSPAADMNGGGLSVQDIFDFLNAWFAGC